MSKYCSNCGSELKENADVCLGITTLIIKIITIFPIIIINQKYQEKVCQ